MISSNLLSSSFSLPPQWALLVSPNPNPASTVYPSSLPPPIHARRFLCRCRRRYSSSDPNAESVRAGRFGFGDKPSSGEVGGDFGQGAPRRWWSDGNPDGDFKEEFDSIDDEEEDGEQLWDKIWIFKHGCRKTIVESRPRIKGRFAKNEKPVEISRTNTNRHNNADTEDQAMILPSSPFK